MGVGGHQKTIETEDHRNVIMSKSSRSYYPRTGRRGVPQQFPIKLYGMLEVESELVQPGNERVIKWSDTGKAFHIEDTVLFSTTILPKYFRTNKFSSFQRNLNLVSLILIVFMRIMQISFIKS